MPFIRVHLRASAIVAVALAATAVCASAASARPVEAPIHQVEQVGPAAPPILAPPAQSDLQATEAQEARAHSYSAPPLARYSSAELNAHLKSAPTGPVSAAKIAVQSNGFHWGDAAIGAAIAAVVVLVVTLGTLALRRRTQLGEA